MTPYVSYNEYMSYNYEYISYNYLDTLMRLSRKARAIIRKPPDGWFQSRMEFLQSAACPGVSDFLQGAFQGLL
jgi:hypothetical protein